MTNIVVTVAIVNYMLAMLDTYIISVIIAGYISQIIFWHLNEKEVKKVYQLAWTEKNRETKYWITINVLTM